MKQFDIYWAELPKISGESNLYYGLRPVVIVSNDQCNTVSPILTAIPLTSNLGKKPLPTHVFISHPNLDNSSLALCEQILSLDRSRLRNKIGHIVKSWDKLAIIHGIETQLGMEVDYEV